MDNPDGEGLLYGPDVGAKVDLTRYHASKHVLGIAHFKPIGEDRVYHLTAGDHGEGKAEDDSTSQQAIFQGMVDAKQPRQVQRDREVMRAVVRVAAQNEVIAPIFALTGRTRRGRVIG